MWRLNSCIPPPDSFDENRETSTPRNARRFPNVWFCFQSVWQSPCPSGHHRSAGDCLQVPMIMIMVSGHCGHPDTLLILTLMTCHVILDILSAHSLSIPCYWHPFIQSVYCLHFCITLVTFLLAICSHQHICTWANQKSVLAQSDQWCNSDIAQHWLTFSHSQTSDHQSLSKQFAGSGLIHFQFLIMESLSVISPRHMGRKTHE